MVGLDGPRRNQGARTQRPRLGKEELQFAGLVATKGQTGLIIPFDEKFWATQGRREPRHRLDGRGQVGKVKAGNIHGEKRPCTNVDIYKEAPGDVKVVLLLLPLMADMGVTP
jgi:hypothetical protein